MTINYNQNPYNAWRIKKPQNKTKKSVDLLKLLDSFYLFQVGIKMVDIVLCSSAAV